MKAWLVVSALLCSTVHAANILVYLPLDTWSHYMQYELLYETLAARGHQVTVYSPYPPKQNITNFTHVYVKNQVFQKLMGNFGKIEDFYNMNWFFMDFYLLLSFHKVVNEEILNDSTYQELIKSKQKFDLVIVEALFAQETTVYLGHMLQAPVICTGATGPNPHMLEMMGASNQVAFMPELYSSLSDEMTFLERIQNLYYTGVRYVFRQARNWYLDKMTKEILGRDLPPVDDLLRNISLTFLYSAAALEYSYPLTSNMVHVGGMHIHRNKSLQLPKDLETILDDASHGFILFSLGSVIKTKTMPLELAENMKVAFSKLSQYKIIWKWSGEPLAGLPSNVVQLKWVPQIPVLAHRNCKLFITHGGLNSHLESVYFGVPIVTIPFFGDQFSTATKVVKFGYGVFLKNSNLTSDSLVWAITEVVSNKRYKEKVLERSRLLRELDSSPVNTAVYWTEYVIRHRGAPHFSPVSRQLYWFQYYLLDILVCILTSLVTVCICVRTLFKTLFAKRKVVQRDRRKMKNKKE